MMCARSSRLDTTLGPGLLKNASVRHGPLDLIAATRQDQYFGSSIHDSAPGNPYRGRAFSSYRVDAARDLDQFRVPVAAAKRRVDPFQMNAAETRERAGGSRPYRLHPSRQ